jgi:hypothetical protein
LTELFSAGEDWFIDQTGLPEAAPPAPPAGAAGHRPAKELLTMSRPNVGTFTCEPISSPGRGRDPRLPAEAAVVSRTLDGRAPLAADRTARQHAEGRRSRRHDVAFWILAGLFLMVFFQAAAATGILLSRARR